MNLNEFNVVTKAINKQKSWIDCDRKVLYSREIRKRQYYSILKKYNPTNNNTDYYILTFDEPISDVAFKPLIRDNYQRTKIYLNEIWIESNMYLFERMCNVLVTAMERTPDSDLYLINLPTPNVDNNTNDV